MRTGNSVELRSYLEVCYTAWSDAEASFGTSTVGENDRPFSASFGTKFKGKGMSTMKVM